jgi:transcriptional regulator with XRE-family HTH domain
MMKLTKLRLARLQAGKSQYDAARETGIPQAYVSLWERGYREPKLVQLAALAECYGVSLKELEPEREGRQ